MPGYSWSDGGVYSGMWNTSARSSAFASIACTCAATACSTSAGVRGPPLERQRERRLHLDARRRRLAGLAAEPHGSSRTIIVPLIRIASVGVEFSRNTTACAFATIGRCSGGGIHTYGTRTFQPSECSVSSVPDVVAFVVSLIARREPGRRVVRRQRVRRERAAAGAGRDRRRHTDQLDVEQLLLRVAGVGGDPTFDR
jgi:hypothetical protein